MTFFPKTQISLADGASVDAFHRLRVSDIIRQFSGMAEYIDNPLIWENATLGTGNLVHIDHQCAVRLDTGGTASGASCIRQTRRYMRYMPGKSLLVAQTFVMSNPQTNAVAEIGYYDSRNGIFLKRDGYTTNFVLRTSTSDSPVDEIIPQSSWNLDKLDGYGASGINLDLTKTQILYIDVQFLGVGRVRVGFDFGSTIVYAHEFLHANINNLAYMSTACLPVRAAVYNTGISTGSVTLDHICCAVVNEGGVGPGNDSEGIFQFSQANGSSLVSTGTTLKPVLSIRAATKLGGSGGETTNRGQILPQIADIYTSADSYYEIWINATLVGPSWQANGPYSLAEYDMSATDITTTNALKVSSGNITSAAKSNTLSFENFINFPIVYTGLNNVQDTITIAVKTLTGFGTAGASLDWIERY